MDWAKGRRITIILSTLGVLALVLIVSAGLLLYRHPSCIDGKQNQDERGIDCGGSCTYLCAADTIAPEVVFARPLEPQGNRTDVIAYVRNKNADASAKGVRYTAEVYDAAGAKLGDRTGTLDLPAGALVPLYLPLVAITDDAVRAFVSLDPSTLRFSRTLDAPAKLVIKDEVIAEGAAPRVTALLVNPTFTSFYDLVVVATVFDASGTAIAASQTLLPELLPQDIKSLVFTWNAPFPGPVGRVELVPVLPVP